MSEQKITELASQINRFEDSANFMRIYFYKPKDVEALRETFSDVGINDIVDARTTKATGSQIDEYMFEVNYRYSSQRKIVDDLEQRHNRMKAWALLRDNGGLQMTDAEKEFFAKRETREKLDLIKRNAEKNTSSRS